MHSNERAGIERERDGAPLQRSWSERIDSDFVAEPGELPMRDRSRPEELRLAVVR
jgi:hypothetical protein